MFCRNKSDVPSRVRGGLVSHFLLQSGDVPGAQLSVTWVDVAPGSSQPLHRHVPEQVFVIVKGKGLIEVAGERRDVSEGDLIHIPGDALHSLSNNGTTSLVYVSAATPPFDLEVLYDRGLLKQ